MENKKYELIGKTLFFPEKRILVIGDLHIGYEYMLQQSGILVPEQQIKEIIDELKGIFKELERKKQKVKKIIFLGDIKHSFSYEWKEKNYFREVFEFLKTKIKEENIIFIKGNHDTMDYSFKGMKNYYILDDIAFIHGHKSFPEAFDKKIKTIVMGHIHPSIILSDKQNIKREKYKCFLTGKYKNKDFIIVPSFLATIEGMTVNEYEDGYEDYFSIIPKKALMKFKVHVVGDNKIYSFGSVSKLL